jgi:hypothetical protein
MWASVQEKSVPFDLTKSLLPKSKQFFLSIKPMTGYAAKRIEGHRKGEITPGQRESA